MDTMEPCKFQKSCDAESCNGLGLIGTVIAMVIALSIVQVVPFDDMVSKEFGPYFGTYDTKKAYHTDLHCPRLGEVKAYDIVRLEETGRRLGCPLCVVSDED